MHVNAGWMAWGALLFFVAFMIRVCLRIRGTWSAARDIAKTDLPLASGIGQSPAAEFSTSFNVSPTVGHAQSTGVSIGVRQHVVYQLDPKTASVHDIPQAVLDLLSPQQRKLLLDKIAEAQHANTESAPSSKAKQGS